MKQMQINIDMPDMSVATESELKITLAAKLYEIEHLSLGQAADAAGLSKRTFAEILGQYGVSLFSQSREELAEDVVNA